MGRGGGERRPKVDRSSSRGEGRKKSRVRREEGGQRRQTFGRRSVVGRSVGPFEKEEEEEERRPWGTGGTRREEEGEQEEKSPAAAARVSTKGFMQVPLAGVVSGGKKRKRKRQEGFPPCSHTQDLDSK